jgi:hypothetical protein
VEIHIKGLKMCKGTKHKHHSTQAQRREAQLREKNDKPKPKHNQSAQNPHKPTLEDQGRPHNETGLKVGQPGCRHTPGGSPRVQPCQGSSNCLPLVGLGRDGGKINAETSV